MSGPVSLWTRELKDSDGKVETQRVILAPVRAACTGYGDRYSSATSDPVGIIARVTDEEAKIAMRHFRLKCELSKRGIKDIDLYGDTIGAVIYGDRLSLDAMQWVVENREEIMADAGVMTQVYKELLDHEPPF